MNSCTLCNRKFQHSDSQWILAEDGLNPTPLGLKLMVLLNIEVKDILEFQKVCPKCGVQISDCFTSLIKIKSSALIMKMLDPKLLNTLGDLFSMKKSKDVLFECKDCSTKIFDVRKYKEHYECHVLEDVKNKFDLPTMDVNLSEEKNIDNSEESLDCNFIGYGSETEDSKKMGEGAYFCDICKECFSSKKVLKGHITKLHLAKTKKRVSVCSYCCTAVEAKSMKAHSARCRGQKFLCHLCGKYMDKKTVKHHMYQHRQLTKGLQACPVCGKSFQTARSMKSHMITHDDAKKVVCEVCGIKTHPYSLWKHVKKHKPKENKCDVCNKGFTFNYMLQAHIKTHETDVRVKRMHTNENARTHQCPECDEKYTYTSMLDLHIKEEHNQISQQIEAMFGCQLCNKTFDDQYSLKNHLLLFHEASKEEVLKLKPAVQLGVFHCTICKLVLQSEYGLRHHIKTVHGLQNREMPAVMRRKCEKCERSFANKAGLTAHIKSVHLNVGYLVCEVCSKTFTRYQGLVNHRLMHLGKKPFECEVCSRTFRQRSDVVRHLRRHVRDGEATLEKATARNNSQSNRIKKSRIFLQDVAT